MGDTRLRAWMTPVSRMSATRLTGRMYASRRGVIDASRRAVIGDPRVRQSVQPDSMTSGSSGSASSDVSDHLQISHLDQLMQDSAALTFAAANFDREGFDAEVDVNPSSLA